MKTTRGTFYGITASLLIFFPAAVCAASPLADPPESREITITASRDDFSPRTINVNRGEHIRLAVTSFDIDKEIKATKTQVIELTPNREGRFQVSCSSSRGDGSPEMFSELAGELIVEG